MGRDAQAEEYVAAAVRQVEVAERLRALRADLVASRWWPMPERRVLLHEIARLTASLEQTEAVLADRDQAAAVATRLIDLAVDETSSGVVLAGAPVLASAVVALLATPGRPPLPEGSSYALTSLPALVDLLGTDAVLRHISLAPAGS
ncbi:MAG: hypothetical protein KJ792_09670 [Actinobacteria bacterium]|nr:hypothetical protein [Actinomycetota bacterium]MCG2802485.1 hypothetical protein [Cellulomonas sp.]